MLTNIKLKLGISHVPSDIHLTISDRYGQLAHIECNDQLTVDLDFKFEIPNRLCIEITNPTQQSNVVTLTACRLGGLDLTQHILDQICQYTPVGAEQFAITPIWNQPGKVHIDFFAGDWIQYHLLYGNKISV